MKRNTSANAMRQPYLRADKWLDGTLAFWRGSGLYSDRVKAWFERKAQEYGVRNRTTAPNFHKI